MLLGHVCSTMCFIKQIPPLALHIDTMACRSKWLAGLAGIWVRPVDKLVGEAVGMRVDVELADGTTAVGIYYHRLLSQSVGCAVLLVAGFCTWARDCMFLQAQFSICHC